MPFKCFPWKTSECWPQPGSPAPPSADTRCMCADRSSCPAMPSGRFFSFRGAGCCGRTALATQGRAILRSAERWVQSPPRTRGWALRRFCLQLNGRCGGHSCPLSPLSANSGANGSPARAVGALGSEGPAEAGPQPRGHEWTTCRSGRESATRCPHRKRFPWCGGAEDAATGVP